MTAGTDVARGDRRRPAREPRRRRAGDAQRDRRPPHPGGARHAVGGRRPRATTGCGSCSTPGPTCSSRCARRSGPSSATTSAARLEALGRDEPRRSARCSWSSSRGYYTDKRVRELIGYPGPDGDRGPLVGVPGLSRGRADRRRARSRAGVAGPGDRAARRRRRTRRGPTQSAGRRTPRRPKEDTMAAIAPDPTESAAPGWLGSFLETWEPGTGAPDRGPRAGDRPAHRDGPRVDPRRRRARRRRGGQGRPAGVGRDELPGAGPRSSAARPTSTRRTATSSARGRSARPAPSHSKMHHESNFAYQRDPQRGDAAVAAVRLADAVGRARAGCRWSGGCRSGSSARSRRGTRRRVLGHARRRAGAGARQRRRPQAGSADAGRRRRDVRGGLPRGRPARGPAPDRRRRRRRRRGARHRPEHLGGLVHRLDGGRAAGRRSWRAACSRRSRSSSAATTRSSCSTTPTSTPPPRPAPSRRSSSRARSASRPAGTSSTAALADDVHRAP